MRWCRWKSGIALLLAWMALAAQAQTLRIATGELPPYASAARADQGISLHIVREAFAREGIRVEYVFMPWTRALVEAREGKWDGTAAWGRSPERDQGFLISDNVLTEQWLLLYRSDRTLDWSRLEDLRGLRIGVVANYTYTADFWRLARAGTLSVDTGPDDVSNLRKLLAGRVDVVPLDRFVACELLGTQFPPAEVARVRAHPRLLSREFTTHLMLTEQRPDSAARMQAFNRGLQALYRSGDHARIVQQQPCKATLAAPGGG